MIVEILPEAEPGLGTQRLEVRAQPSPIRKMAGAHRPVGRFTKAFGLIHLAAYIGN